MAEKKTSKQRAPYFQTVFPGPVGLISSGTWDGTWTRRAYVDIGSYRARSVIADSQMGTALSEAQNDPESTIRLGHMIIGRWVLSVTSDGHTERQGLIMFLLGILATTIIMLIVFSILAVLITDLGSYRDFVIWPVLVGVVISALHIVLNFKARFGF